MASIPTPYEDLLRDVLANGTHKSDRTGTGTTSVFGRQLRFDLAAGFPLITTKRVHFKSVAIELLFFLGGHTNTHWLRDRGVKIWNEWGDANGNLGPMYSHQWTNWGGRPMNVPQPVTKLDATYAPTVYGVGNRGSYRRGSSFVEDRLFVTWKAMLARCYNPKSDKYAYYGGKGVSVHNDWLLFDNFAVDAKLLAGWEQKEATWGEYQLDKDTVGTGFLYSSRTCAWITRSENKRGQQHHVYEFAHNDGRVATVHDVVAFREAHNISQGNFSSMLRGERPVSGGWHIVNARDTWQGIDQISNVIEQIRVNRTPAGSSSPRGTLTRWTTWPCRRATPSSSSTSPTASSPASCTSAAPTSSSVSRSTSPPTRSSLS